MNLAGGEVRRRLLSSEKGCGVPELPLEIYWQRDDDTGQIKPMRVVDRFPVRRGQMEGKKYREIRYTVVKVRPATEDEVAQWRDLG